MNENHGNLEDEGDDVARLLRVAGKRPPMPPERVERVRAAALLQWQEVLRRSPSRRYAWAAALAAAAGLVILIRILAFGTGAPTSGAAASVDSSAGSAWVRNAPDRSESERPIAVGDGVALGSEVVTAAGARVALRLASAHSLRLDGSTRIRLLDATSVALDQGALYVDSGNAAAGVGPLSVHTALGVIREIGTQYEVRVDDGALRVRLREGGVVVRRGGETHELQAGNELRLAADGTASRRPAPIHGPEWEWIAGITPMLDLEGQSARSFLDWVARERGWSLAFDDEDVARSAEAIVLRGTARRLTLDEVLDAVLPTCRMTYRVESGVLRIAPLPQSSSSSRSAAPAWWSSASSAASGLPSGETATSRRTPSTSYRAS